MNALPLTLSALGALAQETPAASADDTGRTITLVIGALLGLALLLAVLTFWYWRRTDPRKATRPAPGPSTVTAGGPPGATTAHRAGSPPARTTAGAAASRRSGSEGTAADRGISAEEWLRLTGARQPAPRDRT